MNFTIAQLLGALEQEAAGLAADLSTSIEGWSIDTRTIERGDLFFALPGTRTSGLEFVHEAFEKGAAAAIATENLPGVRGPVITVPDPARTLAQFGMWARRQWNGSVIGVTGSAGKTTTKEAIAQMLRTAVSTYANPGNLNNHLGLPLSILRMPAQARVAVFEMGMNHAGEIRELCRIAAPSVGVVTNVGSAHIEYFESIEGIAAAKRELIEGLPPEGTAVLNQDDPRVAAFRLVHPGPVITFGLSEEADVRPQQVQWMPEGAAFHVEGVPFQTAMPGQHGVRNVLAALSVAKAFGLPLHRLRDVVAGLRPLGMRGERRIVNGIVILNDSYNANPEACRLMIDLLAQEPASRRVAVLGEMRELGRLSEGLHREVGRYAADCRIDWIVGVAGDARYLVEEARLAGSPGIQARFFDHPTEAGDFLREMAQTGDAILFKGSRGTRVEQALERMES